MKRISIACILLISAAALSSPLAAQSPAAALILTWKAHSYAPIAYAGKALPSAKTPIDIAAALVEKNNVAAIAPYEIQWYLNDALAGRGLGKSLFSFVAPQTGEDAVEVRAHIPHYRGETLDAFITIPIVRPEVVITNAKPPFLEPLFYFFTVADPSSLTVQWDDNGETITVRASNNDNPLEFAQARATKQ